MQLKLNGLYNLLVAVVLLSMSACSWVKDELPECPPTELRLRFEYDYNMMWADAFSKHVGGVTVYVFDENDCLVMQKSESSPERLGTYGYEMVFTDQELELDREYRFVTVAFQDDEQELLKGDGAKFRTAALQPGDNIGSLQVKLDRSERQDDNGAYYVENKEKTLDILWISRNDCRGALHLYETTRCTLNLMRHTNNLTISLRELDEPAETDIDNFIIRVTDRNGWVNYDNSLREDDWLVYTPYAEWNTDFKDDEDNVVERTAHADLSVPRLMYRDDRQNNARLTIFCKETNKMVADINLPDLLVEDRNSLELLHCGEQEFLDREYTYKLDFFLKGDTWESVEISISVLKWAVRNQSVGL